MPPEAWGALAETVAPLPADNPAGLAGFLATPGPRLLLAADAALPTASLLLAEALIGRAAAPEIGLLVPDSATGLALGLALRADLRLDPPEAPTEHPAALLHAILFAARKAGRDVRALPGLGLTAPPPDPAALEAIALIARQAFGHVPLAWVERLAEALAPDAPFATRLARLRRLDAALNGTEAALDSLAAPTTPEAERTDRAVLGCTLPRVAQRLVLPAEDPAPEETLLVQDGHRVVVRRDPAWRAGALARGAERLEAARMARRNDTCVIVGNGPSLLLSNLALLDRADVFISNYAFRHKALRDTARYFTVVNTLVAEQEAERINLLEGPMKIVPDFLAHVLREEAGAVFLPATGAPPRFVADALAGPCWASTVSFFNLQLAYWLGYRRVLLIGFDHRYTQPPGVAEGALIAQQGPDRNHFSPEYFRGKLWQAADVDMMGAVLELAKLAFEQDGRRILNCTPGGALDVFPRSTLEAELIPAAPRPPPVTTTRWDRLSVFGAMRDAGYAHVSLRLDGLQAPTRRWRSFVCRLQWVAGRAVLELRQDDSVPYAFADWPADGAEDEWGPWHRFPLDAPDRAVAEALGFARRMQGTDGSALIAVFRALPSWLSEAAAQDPEALEPWADLTPGITACCNAIAAKAA